MRKIGGKLGYLKKSTAALLCAHKFPLALEKDQIDRSGLHGDLLAGFMHLVGASAYEDGAFGIENEVIVF